MDPRVKDLMALNAAELMDLAQQALMDDEQAQVKRGDEFVIYGSAVFKVELEGYHLQLSVFDSGPELVLNVMAYAAPGDTSWTVVG